MNKYIEKLEVNKNKLVKLKEELAKKQHKVQLGLVDDLQNSIGEADSIIQEARNDMDKMEGLITDYENIGDRLSDAYTNLDTAARDMKQVQDAISSDMAALQNSARELGISTDDIPAYREADTMFDLLDNRMIQIEDMLGDYENLI